MLRSVLALSVAALLSGCASFGVAPRPAEVSLTKTDLVVTLTDASRCTVARPEGAEWSGTLQGCATPWPYRVELDPRTNILSRVVEAVFERAESVRLNAFGTVTITDPATGEVFTFVSPPAS